MTETTREERQEAWDQLLDHGIAPGENMASLLLEDADSAEELEGHMEAIVACIREAGYEIINVTTDDEPEFRWMMVPADDGE